jgi:hypothetical protein
MKTIGGYENRDGMEQYNRDTMVKVIDDKHYFTKNLINVNSSASKAGKKVIYKKDHTALLKQIISMSGDYTRADVFKPTKNTDVSDVKYEQTEEISNRMGDQIYGYMKPDNVHVKKEVVAKSTKLVGGENMGSMAQGEVGGVGLFQAGLLEQEYKNGQRRESNHETEDGYVASDEIRAKWLPKPLGGYDSSHMWTGSGHQPGYRKMREMPLSI